MSDALEIRRASQLEQEPQERRWLVEGLWAERAVGIVGGEPKCCKSFLALDMAVSVASGAPCLRRYLPARRGRVLLFAAEDALHVVRRRLEGIAHAADVDFDHLDVHVITTPTVRLDLQRDRLRLRDAVADLRPTLLVLDPLVRLHRIDENVAAEVAPLLGYLRDLERNLETAVLLVHHARKGGHSRAGQALRGSSELHAWGDSNLYLRRAGDRLLMAIEHRAAPSRERIPLALRDDGGGLALHVVDDEPVAEGAEEAGAAPLDERIITAIHAADADVVSAKQIRQACRVRNVDLLEALARLRDERRIMKVRRGYRLNDSDSRFPPP